MIQPRLKPIVIGVSFVLVMSLWGIVQGSMDASDRKSTPRYDLIVERPKMLRQDSIDRLFSKVDGSHLVLTKYFEGNSERS